MNRYRRLDLPAEAGSHKSDDVVSSEDLEENMPTSVSIATTWAKTTVTTRIG